MRFSLTRSALVGAMLAAVTLTPVAQAAPASNPGAIRAAMDNAPATVIDVRNRGGGGPRWHGPRGGGRHGWHGGGGPRHGWNGGGRRHWNNGWHGGPRYGWRGDRWRYRNGGGYWGPGWGFAAGALLAAPYYYNQDCGYTRVKYRVRGGWAWRRVYQCW